MKVIVDPKGGCADLGISISQLATQGYTSIMLLQAEGIIDSTPNHGKMLGKGLSVAAKNGVQIFGGIFPAVFDKDTILDNGSILVGFDADVHVVALQNISADNVLSQIEAGIAPIKDQLKQGHYNTLFAFGDGFGEVNLELIKGLNHLVKQYPMTVMGGMTGRSAIKMSHFTIFTPESVLQNGAVLAFTKLRSSVGVRHGWEPLKGAEIRISQTNGCFVEKINSVPAFSRYVQMVSSYDSRAAKLLEQEHMDPDVFFNIAVRYPLGLIREHQGETVYINRTPLCVGPDKSLQFSVEIPEETNACIMHLAGESNAERCRNLSHSSLQAYEEAMENQPADIKTSRVLVMDCFGRRKAVEAMGEDYSKVELANMVNAQNSIDHSPAGALCFGEISSMNNSYVELHNKTAVVGVVEDG